MIKGRQKDEADRENDREEVSKNIFRKAMFRDRFGAVFGLGGWRHDSLGRGEGAGAAKCHAYAGGFFWAFGSLGV